MAAFGDGISRLERALRYPYERPPGSYVLVGGDVFLYAEIGGDPLREGSVLVSGNEVAVGEVVPEQYGSRTAVVGYGSNAAPVQLRDKFEAFTDVVIPTIRVTLVDLDVVYAPVVSHYGSIPATLAHAPGTRVEAWIQLLTEAQLERMHDSESRGKHYDFGEYLGPAVECEGSYEPEAVHVYWSCEGCLVDGGEPIPIAAIPAVGRARPGSSQREVQGWLQRRMDETGDLRAFIRAGITSKVEQERRMEVLRAHSRARDESRFRIMEP